MDTAIKNGATSKGDSQVANTSVPDGRVSGPERAAAKAAHKAALRQIEADEKAEAILQRRAKAEKAQADKNREAEARTERVYRTFHSVIPPASAGRDERNKAIEAIGLILAEFKNGQVDARYTQAAIKARKEAAILAAVGK